jgi:para-nitrobenzyl esterase
VPDEWGWGWKAGRRRALQRDSPPPSPPAFPLPTADNTAYLPTSPFAAFTSGAVLDVPIVIGTTRNESTLFINFAIAANGSLSADEYGLALDVILGDGAAAVQQQYPLPSPPPTDNRLSLMLVGTDALFVCPTRNATASVAATIGTSRRSGIWLYHYEHVESFNPAAWGTVYPFTQCWDVVCHGAGLISLFAPNYPQYGTNYTAEEVALSRSMQSWWSAVAANGLPGQGRRGEQIQWPQYNGSGRQVLVLEAGAVTVAGGASPICDFWDAQVGYDFY